MIWFWVIRLAFIGLIAICIFWLYRNHLSDEEIKKALRTAKIYDGRFSLIDLSMDMDIPIERAERIMEKLMQLGLATIDLDSLDEGGEITYIVHRALPKDAGAIKSSSKNIDYANVGDYMKEREL